MDDLIKYSKTITDNISQHIGFDINEMFDVGENIAIYGGAVRDSIANKKINDIDIACLSTECGELSKYFIDKGFILLEDFAKIENFEMYKDINIINMPLTYIKNNKMVQLITPSSKIGNNWVSHYSLLSSVDISCCGVFIEKSNNKILLMESVPHGVIDSFCGIFNVFDKNAMYLENRTHKRVDKLKSRGWIDLDYLKELEKYKDDKFSLSLMMSSNDPKIEDLPIVKRKIKLGRINFNNIEKNYNYKKHSVSINVILDVIEKREEDRKKMYSNRKSGDIKGIEDLFGF